MDWRVTLKRRGSSSRRRLLALWVAGIETRLVYLQVVEHADLVARAERQQLRTIRRRPSAATSSIGAAACSATSVDADSIYAVPSEIDDPADAATQLCDAFGDCTPRSGRRSPSGSAAIARSRTCGGRCRRTRRAASPR